MDSSSFLISACSSATKDVVTLSKGTLNAFDTRLKPEAETPTAANSTAPAWRNLIKGEFSIQQQSFINTSQNKQNQRKDNTCYHN